MSDRGASRTFAGATTTAGVFNVRSYGAKGDNTTDDTAAINAAVSAAYNAGVANGTYYGQVYFPPGTYLVSAAATQGGATKGNAQIPLPVAATTGQKFQLDLIGLGDATGLWHWQQTSPQIGGATIRSTLVGTNDATFGEASVIGGPTPPQGYGQATSVFSNLLVRVDGLRIVVPNDPHVCGIDLRGCAEVNVANASCMVNAVPGTVVGASQAWQFGLAMPENNNNDNSTIGSFSAEGMNYAVMLDEHTVADSIHAIYCVAAVEVGQGGSDTAHGALVNYISAESCNVGVGAISGGYPCKVDIRTLDWEGSGFNGGGFAVINDPSNALHGTIGVTQVGLTHLSAGTGGFTINGGSRVRVYDLTRIQGNAVTSGYTSPTVPATTVALTNPFYRDCAVTVTGGTVTAIAVDSVATGLTSGTVIVPTNRAIKLTYSVAPSWVWTLL